MNDLGDAEEEVKAAAKEAASTPEEQAKPVLNWTARGQSYSACQEMVR